MKSDFKIEKDHHLIRPGYKIEKEWCLIKPGWISEKTFPNKVWI